LDQRQTSGQRKSDEIISLGCDNIGHRKKKKSISGIRHLTDIQAKGLEAMAEFQAHQQLILRLPDALADAVRGEMALDGEMEAIEVKPQGTHEDKGRNYIYVCHKESILALLFMSYLLNSFAPADVWLRCMQTYLPTSFSSGTVAIGTQPCLLTCPATWRRTRPSTT
jgi:hypothetical protein